MKKLLPFLILSSLAGCATNSIQDEDALPEDPFERAIASRSLVYGMPMSDVRDMWGEPTKIDVAGDPASGNQLWHYTSSLKSPKVVYFESGRVVGWRSGARR